jgi:hypothetical protein
MKGTKEGILRKEEPMSGKAVRPERRKDEKIEKRHKGRREGGGREGGGGGEREREREEDVQEGGRENCDRHPYQIQLRENEKSN